MKRKPAILALSDGTVFEGYSFGAEGETIGEVVFNTSMTGYQEILTDPSYKGQIVTMTYTEQGNYGVNSEDVESWRPWVEGFIVKDPATRPSNWRYEKERIGLEDYLKKNKITGICGIDTRALTKHLRTLGAMEGVISTVASPEAAYEKAVKSKGLVGKDLVKEVSCKEPYKWDEGLWSIEGGYAKEIILSHGERRGEVGLGIPSHLKEGDVFKPSIAKGEGEQKAHIFPPFFKGRGTHAEHGSGGINGEKRFKVVAYDFGIKRSILRNLVSSGCDVTVVPAGTTADKVLGMNPDGIFLSNGPGDPEPVKYAQDNIKKLIGKKPIFGICLGHQLLSLALGGKTYKMKFGHRGGNQPVKDLKTGKVEITCQNHGFAVQMESLEGIAELTHVNLNDNTVEGITHKDYPLFSVQYHPEASPGPHDAAYLFKRFIEEMGK